jgi:TRAP-type C4-dicarboxylate transport system permease small subunit
MGDQDQPIRVDYWIAAVLLFAMAAIAFINVLSRYLFHFSFAATEEITINLFVWLTVVGSGIAFERGGQLGMVTLYNVFPTRFKRVVVLFSAGMSALLFILVDLFTIQAIKDEVTLFHATSAALGIPVWIYYLGVPVFSVFVFRGIYRNAFSRLDTLEREEREEKG